MPRRKKSRPEIDLPTAVMNKLRGSRRPAETVSDLRDEIDPKLFPTLLKKLPLFPQRGKSLLPSLGHSLERFRVDVPTLRPVGLDRELAWAAAIFRQYSDVLDRFINLKLQFESHLLLGDYDDCEKVLDQLEKEFGVSVWLLETRIAFLQTSRGLEAQKAYCSHLQSARPNVDLLSFFEHYASWRNEDTTNPFQFKKAISEKASEWSISTDFRSFLLFKLTGDCPIDEETIAYILTYEASYSLVDYYESFIQLTIKYFASEPFTPRPAYNSALISMVKKIRDQRLAKLAALAGPGSFDYLKRCKTRSLVSDEALLVGNYSAFKSAVEAVIQETPDDIRLWFNAANAELDSTTSLRFSKGVGARFLAILKAVIEKENGFEDSVLEGARLILNYRHLPSAAQFESFFWPQLSSKPNPSPHTQVAAFISSRFLEPSMLRSLPLSWRQEFTRVLEQMYGDCLIVDFEKWRSDDDVTLRERLQSIITTKLFHEVVIEHHAENGRHIEALEVARQLEVSTERRLKRVAQRWVAECLLATGKIQEVVDHVCRVCVSDRNAIPMMPLARCASALDKAHRSALAGNLSASIVLDIYDRKFESTYESERNYAYEDFLTAHGIQRPSQLKDRVHEFDHNLLVYYLQFICIPEVMQISTAFSSSRELDEERVAVCAILAQIDVENLEEHETEIRDITRKLVVRRGVREVEQSKIYVDMPAIRRWADKSLKESFTRYQALANAGLDAGGAGIDEAIRDFLSGTPISEEYLRLPKNEMSGLLVNMVADFFAQCLKNPAHGLDCYLSMRIRHGALAGQLRAPLEQEAVIFQREGPLDEYKPNDYWRSQLGYWPNEVPAGIEKRIGVFSKAFDALVDRTASDYLQIQSIDKPKGVFRLPLSALVVRALASDIAPTTTFEDFMNLCVYLFWQLLDPCLKDVHQTIERKVKHEMTQLFESLRADLKKLHGTYNVAQLDAAILNAQTKAQQALEQVKDWFRVPKPLTKKTLGLEEIVEIGLECVRNLHPDFRPELSIDSPEKLFRVTELSLFSDIFFIIFDNVRKHSGLTAPNVRVSVQVVAETSLEIEVENSLATHAITSDREIKISEIKEAIAKGEGEYLPAVRSEGGTGLKKLRNILRRDASSPRKLDFGFESQNFFVRFDLPIFEVLKESEEKVTDA
jgi:hypothetical protein